MKDLLLVVGALLLPFSTGVDSGFYVMSFGLPFLALYAVFGAILIIMHLSGWQISVSLLPTVLSAFVLVAAIILFTGFSPSVYQSAYRAAVNITGFLIALYLIMRADIHPEKLLKKILQILVYSGSILAIYFILNTLLAVQLYGIEKVMLERFTGGAMSLPWGATNVITAALLLPHITVYLLKARYGLRYASIYICLILLAVFITMSRTGLFTHLLILVIASFAFRQGRLIVLGLSAFIVFGYIFYSISPDTFDYLFKTRISIERVNSRFDIWQDHWMFWLGNLMRPIGYYGSLTTFDGVSSHNFILTLLLEQGVLGLIFVGMFLSSTYIVVSKSPCISKRDLLSRRLFLQGGIVAFLGLMLEDANYTQPYIIYFWLFYASAVLFCKASRREDKYASNVYSSRMGSQYSHQI